MLELHADRYFKFIAKCFPVMCASNEFDFLPRAEDSARYYDKTENLEAGAIQDAVRELKQFRAGFAKLRVKQDILFEESVDLDLLIANITGALIELETKESFRNNPLLYLKIAFIGLDHALNRPAETPEEVKNRISIRLRAIPVLLAQGRANLSFIPESYYGHAAAMTADCKHYLESVIKLNRNASLEQGFANALEAVDVYREFLLSSKPLPDRHFSSDTLDASIRGHFMCARSLDEIFQIAVNDWNDNLENLENIGEQIDPDLPWQDLYHQISPDDMGDISIIDRYRMEAENIGEFFREKGLVHEDLCTGLVICETPAYLRSVRASASFAAALNADQRGKDYFHITTSRFDYSKPETLKLLTERLHREYKFLTAHETIPGHYFLDSIRRKLENPVRRQIESPLFYEGWASYAETLLADYGYVTRPEELLVDFRRRLWLAARCQIDVGIPTGNLHQEDAVRLLTTTGFTREEAISQINRFRLYPGYQLCYSLGSFEIKELKEKYVPVLGSRRFHDALLEGGEIPFQLVEKRLENSLKTEAEGTS
jgi:Bacterial protein of unknown function (DUF885)